MTFLELLEDKGIDTRTPGEHEHTRAGWIQMDCPFCSADWKHFRLGYNVRSDYLNCWSCGSHSIPETLVALLGCSYSHAKRLVPPHGREPQSSEAPEDRRGHLVFPKGLGELLPAHRRYLRGRGFDPEEIVRLWGIRGIGIAARLPWRLWIPVVHRARTVSWTTRAIVDRGVRYLSAADNEEVCNHKHLLYGEDYCRHAIIVHEGPTDAWATGPGAVGTLGTSYTRQQVLRIARYPVRVVCFDNETSAQQRARALCDMLMDFPGDTYNVVLDAKDSATASRKEIKRLRTFLK